MSKFYEQTMEDISICPYCGGSDTDLEVSYEAEDQRHCYECDEDYFIVYKEDSYDEDECEYEEIEDITDRHNKSLKNK